MSHDRVFAAQLLFALALPSCLFAAMGKAMPAKIPCAIARLQGQALIVAPLSSNGLVGVRTIKPLSQQHVLAVLAGQVPAIPGKAETAAPVRTDAAAPMVELSKAIADEISILQAPNISAEGAYAAEQRLEDLMTGRRSIGASNEAGGAAFTNPDLDKEAAPDLIASLPPALAAALSAPYRTEAEYKEFIHGNRNISPAHSVRRAMRALEPALQRLTPSTLNGLRIHEVARLAFILFFSGLTPAARYDSGDAAMVQALQRAGFVESSAPGRHWTHHWQNISRQAFATIAGERGFSPREIQLGLALFREVPALNHVTATSELVRYSGKEDLEDFRKYYGDTAADELRQRAGKAGVAPGVLFRLSLAFSAAFAAITPYDLRSLRYQDGSWRLSVDMDELGLDDFAKASKEGIDPELYDVTARGPAQAWPAAGHPLYEGTQLDPRGIVLVHARHDLPDEHGWIYPNNRYGEAHPLDRSPRQIIEFSWNGVVDQWNNANIAVFVPLDKAQSTVQGRLVNLWYNGTAVLGPYQLPRGSVVMVRAGTPIPPGRTAAFERLGIELVLFDADLPADEGGRRVLEQRGYAAMSLGTDLFGGEGVQTTWMPAALDGEDFFAPKNEARGAELSRRLAERLAIPWAAALSGHPLGRLSSTMENRWLRFAREGHLKTSYESISDFERDLDAFKEDLLTVLKVAPAGDRHWEQFLSYARFVYKLMIFELEFILSRRTPKLDERDVPEEAELIRRMRALAQTLSSSLDAPPALAPKASLGN